ncbi:hypothetical protein H4R19_007281 [Coemansia spiralis]|nr:hypothetical protein H4R19_007281 [Coemansia spiralis]
MIAGTESDSALPADIASAPVEAGSSQLPSATAAAATSPMQMGGMGESESSSGARNAKTTSEVLQSATSIASNSARSPLFAGGAWGPSSSSDAVRSGAAGATHAAASSDSSSDLWAGLFPPLSSSAPGSADGAAGTTGAKPSHVESEAPASESDEQPLDSDFLESDFLDSEPTANESAGDMTMASGLLPFPPMGGPHAQQPSDASSAQPTPTGSSQAGSAGAIQTIDILDASNENALESSIDAVIHSVIQDYQAQATPKAAVGFALIHPRSVAAPEWI